MPCRHRTWSALAGALLLLLMACSALGAAPVVERLFTQASAPVRAAELSESDEVVPYPQDEERPLAAIRRSVLEGPGRAKFSLALPRSAFKAAAKGAKARAARAPIVKGNGIEFHGGPVMRSFQVQLVLYGTWGSKRAQDTLKIQYSFLDLMAKNHPWWQIQQTYTDRYRKPCGPFTVNHKYLSYAKFRTPYGKSLKEGWHMKVFKDMFRTSKPDGTKVYAILTTPDIRVEGSLGTFCKDYCGYHSYATIRGVLIKFAFVGNAEGSPFCKDQCLDYDLRRLGSPNDNFGADGMASILGHELAEVATDPLINAWYRNVDLQENADLCSWVTGTSFITKTPKGKKGVCNICNGKLGQRFHIQQNWSARLGKCVANNK